jgi:hypothetical protein
MKTRTETLMNRVRLNLTPRHPTKWSIKSQDLQVYEVAGQYLSFCRVHFEGRPNDSEHMDLIV